MPEFSNRGPSERFVYDFLADTGMLTYRTDDDGFFAPHYRDQPLAALLTAVPLPDGYPTPLERDAYLEVLHRYIEGNA
jgi:hypothetical protein